MCWTIQRKKYLRSPLLSDNLSRLPSCWGNSTSISHISVRVRPKGATSARADLVNESAACAPRIAPRVKSHR
jgi:hypothetical protein